jgi:hypothetical protein
MPWKSGHSSKIQDSGWRLAEPVGVQPKTAAAKRGKLSEEQKKKLKELLGYYVKISARCNAKVRESD